MSKRHRRLIEAMVNEDPGLSALQIVERLKDQAGPRWAPVREEVAGYVSFVKRRKAKESEKRG